MRGGCPRPDRHRCPPPRWNIVSDTPPACGAVRATPLVPRPELARRTVPAIASAPERCQQQVRVPRPAPGAFPGCPSTADGPGPCALRRYWGGTIWLPPGGAALTVAFGAHRTRRSAICLCRDVVRETLNAAIGVYLLHANAEQRSEIFATIDSLSLLVSSVATPEAQAEAHLSTTFTSGDVWTGFGTPSWVTHDSSVHSG